MRIPFFPSRTGDEPIRIPLPELLQNRFGIYFRPSGSSLPGTGELMAAVRSWLSTQSTGPLRAGAESYLDQAWISVRIAPKEALPGPPVELLRYSGAGEAEQRRYRNATHVVGISAPDAVGPLRIGFWSAVAGSRAIASALDGVILDPELPRLEPLDTHAAPLPDDPRISISEQTIVVCSTDSRGLDWITTKGLGKFGLPDLEIRDVPPDLGQPLRPVVIGMARYLVTQAVQAGAEAGVPARELRLGPEVHFVLEELAGGSGSEKQPEPQGGARGWTLIRLESRPAGSGRCAFVRLVPPRGFQGDQGVWLNSLLVELVGSADTLRYVAADSEAMEAAHLGARDRLPEVKRRFQAGLRPGERLYVKHGFPTREGHEYMWLVVNTWESDQLRGQLANDPKTRLDLRAGQTVSLRESDLFDWLIALPDGSREGGLTIRVVQNEGINDNRDST